MNGLRKVAQAVWDSRVKREIYSDEHGHSYYYAVNGDALEDMACALAEPEWTRVEKALPEDRIIVKMLCGNEGTLWAGIGKYDAGWWYQTDAGWIEIDGVTHWSSIHWPSYPEVE